ncbi:MAG TPA: AMP-binding protein, partial [Jiangellales bacterium]|nr:AMP-binding protein [Jiangellales bacterium]
MPSRTAGDALSHPQGGEGGTVSDGVHDLVSRWVVSRPDACAVQDVASSTAPPRELTYRELWRHAGWLAEELSGRGVGRGDLVAVAIDRSVDLVVALLGIVRAGAAYLPLDSYAPPDRIATILADSRTELVVCAADPGAARDRLAALHVDARRVPVPMAGPDAVTSVTVTAHDPVYVAFTSGSTGRPKGVVVPHRAVKRLVVAPNYCVIAPGDRVANLSNPAFDATTFEIWSTLAAGGTVVVFPSLSTLGLDDWSARVRVENITTMFLTTSLFHTVAWERPGAFAGL